MYKLCYMLALLTFLSCEKSADQTAVNPTTSKSLNFEENVALFDARVRAVDAKNFVKELVFANFSDQKILDNAIYFKDVAYTDDGKQFDAKAGDGIFTAVEKSAYNEAIKLGSLTGSQPKSLLDAPIVNANFKKSEELAAYQLNAARYTPTAPNARALLIPHPAPAYVCTVTYGGHHCLAYQNGWCNSCCMELTDCHWTWQWVL